MILDIRFSDRGPQQYQGVRMTTVYLDSNSRSEPELVIHFNKFESGQLSLELKYITSIQVTND